MKAFKSVSAFIHRSSFLLHPCISSFILYIVGMAKKKSKFLRGRRIDPKPIAGEMALADLIDETFLAYNAARLREACQLFTQKMLEPDVTVGLSLTGALTPAGLGISALIPLIKAGFIDWVITTGANLYHDAHFGIGLSMHQGNAQTSD